MIFDEEKLKDLGYHWNFNKWYMFKNTNRNEANAGVVFVYENGNIEVENEDDLTEIEIAKLKKEGLI